MVKYIEHPLIKPEKIEARLYQQKIAADVLKKGNSMIVAPTALGKTVIAVLVAAERLRKYKKSKILILAPSKPLTIQHEESFQEFLTLPCTSITGAVNPTERAKRWKESQIICATPQTVESDIINGRYSLKDVSLIVFDECHHAIGSYSYVYLASHYQKEAQNPLILGLTASPGFEKEKIEKVCENLFIKEIIIKTEDDPDVSPYFNPIEIEWIKVKMGSTLKNIKKHLEKARKHRLKMLKHLHIIPTVTVTKKDLLKARGKVQNRIARTTNPPKKYYMGISLLAAAINIEHAIELLETQGISTLHQYFLRLQKKNTKAAKSLIADPNFSRAMIETRRAYRRGIEHPKLDKLMKILKKELKKEDIKRIIVFTQFRDTVEQIYKKCQEEKIKAAKFYGQGTRTGTKGLTQKEQKEIIKAFRIGKYDILISTSVAEEGMDIPAVDLVILYEPVPSEIRMIQRRGRTGRKKMGRMMVMITEKTRDEAYYWSSIQKENKMKKHLQKAKNMELEIKSETTEHQKTIQGKYIVYADSREVNSRVLRELTRMDVEVIIKPMAVADYQVSDQVAIERKTTKDFINSLIDKRLYKQAKELVTEFKKPIMILEGEDLYSAFINPNAIRGAIASIAVDFGIPIIPTRSPEDTAAMIKRIAVREQSKEKVEIQIRTEKKPLTLKERQLFIVESLPHIGSVNARKLLKHFKTIKDLVNASEKELKKVEGIGEKIAREIRKVLDSEFEG